MAANERHRVLEPAEPRPLPSWRLRIHFVAILATAVGLGFLLIPWIGVWAWSIPFSVFVATFILPDLLFPRQAVLLRTDEHGVHYADFSQAIFAPWEAIAGIQKQERLNRVDVQIAHPRSNFSVPLAHANAQDVLEEIRRRMEAGNEMGEERLPSDGEDAAAEG